jgi:hypothetical protein
MFSIMQILDKSQQELFSVMSWSIWKRRNNIVWEHAVETNQVVCDRAINLLASWRNVQQLQYLTILVLSDSPSLAWSKPNLGRYKCNVDPSFSNGLNKVGIYICIRDDHDRFVLARTEWISPILDVEVGKAIGLLTADEYGF